MWDHKDVRIDGRDLVVYFRQADKTAMEVAIWKADGFGRRKLARLWAGTQGRKPGRLAQLALEAAGAEVR